MSGIRAEEGLSNGELEEAPHPLHKDPNQKDIIGLALSPVLQEKPNGSSSPPKQSTPRKTGRKETDYDGSNSGEHSESEETGIPASLETRMAVIDILAKQGVALAATEANGVFVRVADSLKNLNSQAGVESHTSRYVAPVLARQSLR